MHEPPLTRTPLGMGTMLTTLGRFIATLALLAVGSLPAAAAVGAWTETDTVSARLVATTDENGAIVGALELQLKPGWKTYWRTPGEGGLPPIFDFSSSWNITGVEVDYPPPHRYNDGYSVTNVYEGRVLFPLRMTSAVANAPGTLHLTLDLGVCEIVCIPMVMDVAVNVRPGEIDPDALDLAEEARSLAPTPPVEETFIIDEVTIAEVQGRNIRLRVTAVVPQAFGAELFVEGPGRWLPFAARQIGANGNHVAYTATIERPNEDVPISGTRLRLTLVSAGGAVEQWFTLP